MQKRKTNIFIQQHIYNNSISNVPTAITDMEKIKHINNKELDLEEGNILKNKDQPSYQNKEKKLLPSHLKNSIIVCTNIVSKNSDNNNLRNRFIREKSKCKSRISNFKKNTPQKNINVRNEFEKNIYHRFNLNATFYNHHPKKHIHQHEYASLDDGYKT